MFRQRLLALGVRRRSCEMTLQELKAYIVRQKAGPDFGRLECSEDAKDRFMRPEALLLRT